MRKPNIWNIHDLLTTGCEAEWTLPDGRKWWGPARAYGQNQIRLMGRWKAAWLVFTGRADALTWPQ